MSMIYCRECGYRYSDKAKSCPKCGYCEYDLSKSMVVYLALAWFLGVFGAHRFYAHKTGSAIVMLVLTCTVFGVFIAAVWALVDFIVGLCNISCPQNIFAGK